MITPTFIIINLAAIKLLSLEGLKQSLPRLVPQIVPKEPIVGMTQISMIRFWYRARSMRKGMLGSEDCATKRRGMRSCVKA